MMTVCDRCKCPRETTFPVYPYVVKVEHENILEHQPQGRFFVELCENCSKDFVVVIGAAIGRFLPGQRGTGSG